MQNYYYNPEVKVLLINHSKEKEQVVYTASNTVLNLPKVGPRPPFYFNPRYQSYFPTL